MDAEGKLITASLRAYTKHKVRERYRSLDEFLQQWRTADQKRAIIAELAEQGVVFADFKAAINQEMDIFDLICHAAFDQPPLTRAERAGNVKKRNYFAKYGAQARLVLEALLEKYADEGIENIEDMQILQVNPLNQFGSPLEIVNLKWSSLCAQKNKGLWQKFGVLSLAGCGAVVTGSCLDILKNVKTATPQKPLQALTDPTIMLRRGT